MRRSKYNAKRTMIDGITFASKREAMRYLALKDMQRRGVIADLELQPSFKLWIPCHDRDENVCVGTYIADFEYKRDGKRTIEDSKGVKTPVYRLKKKMVEAFYGVRIVEV